jgi:hypothetical protein
VTDLPEPSPHCTYVPGWAQVSFNLKLNQPTQAVNPRFPWRPCSATWIGVRTCPMCPVGMIALCTSSGTPSTP